MPVTETSIGTPLSDPVTSPAHYTQGQVEVIDFIAEQLEGHGFVDYCRGNVIKYVARGPFKVLEAQDYAKAAWYAQMAAHALDPDRFRDPRHEEA